MVQGEEVVATADRKMGGAEGGRSASGRRGRPRRLPHGGGHHLNSPGAWTIRPGLGGQGGRRGRLLRWGAAWRRRGGGGSSVVALSATAVAAWQRRGSSAVAALNVTLAN